jgi:hypothetical protein
MDFVINLLSQQPLVTLFLTSANLVLRNLRAQINLTLATP